LIVLFLCSFIFLFIPWYLLEKPEMDVSQIQFNYSIFFLNALSAFALNISIFLVIGRTGAVTIRVAGVLKDWILIALSTIIFPESVITSLNIIGYAVGNYVVLLHLEEHVDILYYACLLLFGSLTSINFTCSAIRCCPVQLFEDERCQSKPASSRQ